MFNPYENINWPSVMRVGSATHMHMARQCDLDNAYKYGIRHFPISNYYPSAPYDAQTRPSDFYLHQHWPAKKSDGTQLEPPVNWNDIITWGHELDEPYQSHLPFKQGELAFTNIPDDVIISPNAEHHGFSNSEAHICCPGSTFISGNIDPQGNKYKVTAHGFCCGFGGTWQEAFGEMRDHMKYPDAGGITINHPTWFSRFTDDQVIEMLDFDACVLGIEIYNDYSAKKDWSQTPYCTAPSESRPGLSTNMWDRILSTHRRCFGFCVPDHSVESGTNWHGRNILLVSEFTEHACLKAYRQGRFYGCLKDNGLTIQEFSATETAISVKTNRPATITFITQTGPVKSTKGHHANYDIPQHNGTPDLTYVRVEIEDDSGEQLFLQPVMYH